RKYSAARQGRAGALRRRSKRYAYSSQHRRGKKTPTRGSIPRDRWVTVPGQGSSQIQAECANAKSRSLKSDPNDTDKAQTAGIKAMQDMVSQVLGVPIHYYGMIDFEGFKQAVDIVGGVDIDVPAELAVKEYLWDSTTGR